MNRLRLGRGDQVIACGYPRERGHLKKHGPTYIDYLKRRGLLQLSQSGNPVYFRHIDPLDKLYVYCGMESCEKYPSCGKCVYEFDLSSSFMASLTISESSG